jgi:hypothetical protein
MASVLRLTIAGCELCAAGLEVEVAVAGDDVGLAVGGLDALEPVATEALAERGTADELVQGGGGGARIGDFRNEAGRSGRIVLADWMGEQLAARTDIGGDDRKAGGGGLIDRFL